jgi:hypothetical protein
VSALHTLQEFGLVVVDGDRTEVRQLVRGWWMS